MKRNCIFPTETSFYESKSTYFTPFFLIAANAVFTCDRDIFPFSEIHWNDVINAAWLFLVILILDNYSLLYLLGLKYALDRSRNNNACAHSKWAGACRNRPRTPESQHACVVWLNVRPVLAKVTGKWQYNQYLCVCVDKGLDGSALFPLTINILVINTEFTKMGNGKSIFLKRKIIGPINGCGLLSSVLLF